MEKIIYNMIHGLKHPSTLKLITFSVVVHLILLKSIFDIHFNSPIVQGILPVPASHEPLAKRVVLFVADGLRADKFYEWGSKNPSSYLRSVIMTQGIWGLSESQVPTESRPGNIAIASGIPEDPSAITRGWKENPVDADSVFNRSSYTWAWGSPDVVPMFARGMTTEHMHYFTYDQEFEDFASKNLLELDNWVLDNFVNFLEKAMSNRTLSTILSEDHTIFFFHLLTMDSLGHSLKPHSIEYESGIKNLDEKVEAIVKLLDLFYAQDHKTSFIFTSDHGMTDWGSHGAGTEDETSCPFVAWGAGINYPTSSINMGEEIHDKWRLSSLKYVQIQQIDIAVLISSLLGNPIPVNSLGSLPVEIINATDDTKSRMMATRALQLLEHAVALERTLDTKVFSSLVWRQYPNVKESVSKELELLQNSIDLGNHTLVSIHADHIGNIALKKIIYYRTYDSAMVSVAVVLIFLGWEAYLVFLILESVLIKDKGYKLLLYQAPRPRQLSFVAVFYYVGGVLAITIIALNLVQGTSLFYSFYFLLPVGLWVMVVNMYEAVNKVITISKVITIPSILGLLLAAEILVMSFYFRWFLSVGLVAIGLTPVLLGYVSKSMSGIWILVCLGLSCFPLLPVIGKESNVHLVLFSGLLGIITFIWFWKRKHSEGHFKLSALTSIQLGMIALAIITVFIVRSSQSSITYLLSCQLFSWTCLVLMFIVPFFGSGILEHQFQHVAMSLFPVYALLSMRHELLFFVCLYITMEVWLSWEIKYNDTMTVHGRSSLQKGNFSNYRTDGRISYLFLYFIILSFFGTGNINSLNSFDPASVFCFLTTFSPFTMATLLMLKVIIPFIMVTTAFVSLCYRIQIARDRTFVMVLILCDIMGLHFWFMVTNQGSWLEIGTSISHFVIVMATIIFLVFLSSICDVLVNPKGIQKYLKTKLR